VLTHAGTFASLAAGATQGLQKSLRLVQI